MDSNALAAWLRLSLTDGVGTQTARVLLTHFGLPEQIFSVGFSALQKVVPDALARGLSGPVSEELAAQIERSLAWVREDGNHILTLADPSYPAALLNIPDPPILLYAKGQIKRLSQPALAIVGSRNASAQGAQNAARFAQSLSSAGLTIISGLATGIDAAAHEGALEAGTQAGSTVAVTGTGLDLVYPARHHQLAHRIAQMGCLLSEYPLGTPAIASNFPRRNRLISGLSLGVLVVEAAAQSGSLITARCALEQGREVFAIPGSIHSPVSKGCHLLIRQGGKLVESAQDVLEELRWPASRDLQTQHMERLVSPSSEAVTPEEASLEGLLKLAGYDAFSVDELVRRSGQSAARIHSALLTLELQSKIEVMPGGQFRRLSL